MRKINNLLNLTLLKASLTTLIIAVLLVSPTSVTAGEIPVELEQFVAEQLADYPDQRDIITALLSDAADVGVTPEALTEIIHQSFERGLVSMEIEEIFDIIIEVGEKNISTEPLTDKVLEGLAKKVDMERLLIALDRTADRLVSADDILKDLDQLGLSADEKDDLLADTVAAIATGVREEELRSVFADLGESGNNNGDLDPKDVVDLLQALVGYGIDSGTAGSLTIHIITSADLESDDLHEIREAVYEEHRKKSSTKNLIATVESYLGGEEDHGSEAYGDQDGEDGSDSYSDDGGDDSGDDGGDDDGGDDEGGEEE